MTIAVLYFALLAWLCVEQDRDFRARFERGEIGDI